MTYLPNVVAIVFVLTLAISAGAYGRRRGRR
jgi:hypothetical protein